MALLDVSVAAQRPPRMYLYHLHQQERIKGQDGRKAVRSARTVFVVTVLGVVAALWLSIVPTPGAVQPGRPPAATFDPSRFILNALLVPALDSDAMPLRWVDPRPALACGPNTTVRVNRKPLVHGELVPDRPFELEWQTNGCRPFGAGGPRFDGRVQLTVFREDWGFSAMVKPWRLRATFPDDKTVLIQPGGASLPQFVEADDEP